MTDREEISLGLDPRVRPFVLSGVLLGVGLGGFFDGIVFHQIFKWHHMASARTDATVLEDLQLNVMLDEFFHAATYGFTVLGIVQLWRARLDPYVPEWGRVLFGAMIAGWGLFNVVEGLVDHQLLGLHHVWPDGPVPSSSGTWHSYGCRVSRWWVRDRTECRGCIDGEE